MNNLQKAIKHLSKTCQPNYRDILQLYRTIAIRRILPNAFEHGQVKATTFGDPEKPFTYVLVLTLGNNDKHEFKMFSGHRPAIPIDLIPGNLMKMLEVHSPLWFAKYSDN